MSDAPMGTANGNFSTEKPQKSGALKRVYQWKYTACRYNIENSNGFYTFSQSAELTKEEKRELSDTVAHYAQLDSAPLRPTSDDLRDPAKFPIAFTSFKLSNGKSVICRVRAVGQDYGGTRYGNFFAHAFVLSDGVWRDPLRYFDSRAFADGLSEAEANLGKTPEPLPTLGLAELEPGSEKNAELFHEFATKAMLDGFIEALYRRKNLVVLAAPQTLANAARIVGDFLRSLPPEIASKIEFTTYSRNPAYELLFKRSKYVFLAFAPLENDEEMPRERAVVVNLEAALQGKRAINAPYAKCLSSKFLENVRHFRYSAAQTLAPVEDETPKQEEQDQRIKDLRHLNRLTILYAMLMGSFPQIESGWEDAWIGLSADKRMVLRERWEETWRFLNEQPVEIQARVAERFLNLDLKRLKEPTFKLQEKVVDKTLKDFRNRSDCFKSRYDIAVARNLTSLAACLYANPFDRELKAKLPEKIFTCWTNQVTDREEFGVWRRELPTEIAEIFDVAGPAAIATNSQKFLAPDHFLEFEMKNGKDERRAWLAIALGMAVAIENPSSEKLGVAVQERLRNLFARFFASTKALGAFERVYKYLWIEKIRDASSYALIFDMLGVRKDGERLKEYVDSLISDDSRNAWKQGKALKRALPRPDDVPNEDGEKEETRELDWNTTEEHTLSNANVGATSKQIKDDAKKESEVEAEPGAYAFVAFLAEEKQESALKKVFKEFSRREFKRAQKFFNAPEPGRNRVDIKDGEREYKWYEVSAWSTKVWLALGSCVLLLGVAIGACVYFFC